MAVLMLGVNGITPQSEQVSRTAASGVNISFVEYNQPTPPLPPDPSPSGSDLSGSGAGDQGAGNLHGSGVLPDSPATGMLGPLSIDYISDFNFGGTSLSIQPVMHTEVMYVVHTALADQGDDGSVISNFIQVKDNRALSQRVGWSLTVEKSDDLMRLGATGRIIEATTIALSDLGATLDSPFEAPWVHESLLLTPQMPDVVARAVVTTEDQSVGSGTWVIMFGDAEEVGVELVVPTASMINLDERYMASLR